ncbi:hypothetical protein HDU76_008331, partial [Blyttiomyces sp. JEL0837]
MPLYSYQRREEDFRYKTPDSIFTLQDKVEVFEWRSELICAQTSSAGHTSNSDNLEVDNRYYFRIVVNSEAIPEDSVALFHYLCQFAIMKVAKTASSDTSIKTVFDKVEV